MDTGVIEKIERYLNDEMQPQERTDFELQLQTDEELQNAFELYNSINNTMKEEDVPEDEKELTQTLQQLNRKYILKGGKVREGNFKKWLAAAAAVVIIVLSAVYFLSQDKLSAEELYAGVAVHAPLKIQLRGNVADSLAGTAADKFNNKHYYEALPLLQQYLQLQPDDIQMRFAEGICQLELDNYSAAENIFTTIAAGRSGFAESAGWYQALTALKQKDLSRCRNLLKAIPQTSQYSTNAGELLKKLPD